MFAGLKHDKLILLQLPGIEAVVCDVSDWNATRRIVEELGDIHLLVNNAGVGELKEALETTPEHFDWYVDWTGIYLFGDSVHILEHRLIYIRNITNTDIPLSL